MPLLSPAHGPRPAFSRIGSVLHCEDVNLADLAERLEGVSMAAPSIPVIANVDVTVHKNPDEIRAALARQACSAVQWVKTIEAMKAAGITDIVECGPGRVLVGLIRRIAPEIKTHNIYDQATLEKTLAALSN